MLLYTLGDEVNLHELGYKILNARRTVPQCYGNESHIDDCNSINATECSPVLVDCGPVSGGDDSSGSGGVIAAAVTVPLLVVLAVVCTAAISLFLLWKNGKLRWDLLKLPHRRK